MATNELDELRRRIAELETENHGLRAAPTRARRNPTRSILSAIAIVLAIVLAPVAVLGTWARAELVDTDRFVATFAPLAEDPQVQAYLSDQVTGAIEENVDVDSLVADLAAGLTGLHLPPRAENAITLLQVPAAQGIRSLIGTAVERIIVSPAFAGVWETALRETHSRAIRIVQGQPGTALTLDGDTLQVDVGTIVAQVKQHLIDDGFGFASSIPEIHRTIPLASSDSFVLVRTIYQVSVVAGYWLPWVVLGLAAAGIALSRHRIRTLALTMLGLVASFLSLAAGFGIGRLFFVGAVSPSTMPSGTAEVLFAQITDTMRSVLVALVLLCAMIGIGAWFAGTSRPATAVRTASDAAFARARESADRHGLGTQRFGTVLDRWRPAVIVITIALALFLLLLSRPITVGAVVWTLVGIGAVLLLVELLRRPGASGAPSAPGSDRAHVEEQA
ncbi:MAG: hypothetical protein WA971_11905 [Microbacterium sp.]